MIPTLQAQDIFDKGIDFMLKALLKGNNPLENGSWFLFYDDSQDYPDGSDLAHYIRTRDMFKNCAATYNLTSSLRVSTGQGLAEFIREAASGIIDVRKDYSKDVVISGWASGEEAVRMIWTAVVREKGLGGLKSDNCIVLFTADLVREGSPFPSLLEQDGGFELVTPGNYAIPSEKIRYTPCLRPRGWKGMLWCLSARQLLKKRMCSRFLSVLRGQGARQSCYPIHNTSFI